MKHTIDSAKYQGYLWYSDKLRPEVYLGDEIIPQIILDDSDNPFVVEGNLYDKESNKSICIKYMDGRHYITVYDFEALENEPDSVLEVESYLTNSRINRAKECSISVYKRIWYAEADKLNDDWKALRPSGFAFAGFKKQ